MALGSSEATASATLDVQGTDGAILLPRLTTTQRDALTPSAGMMIYNTTTSTVQGYTSSWGSIGGGGSTRTVGADTTLTASDSIAISTTELEQTYLVYGDTTAVTLSTTPFGATDPTNGTRITLVGVTPLRQ